MDFQGIMPSEISQRKTNIVCSHLYVESKKITTTKLRDRENRWVVNRSEGGGERNGSKGKRKKK